MLTTLMGLIGSPIVGSLVGFLGSWVTKREERKTLELNLSHAVKMATITHKNKQESISLEGEMKEKEIDANAFLSSQKYGNKGTGWGTSLMSAMRPVITLYLLTICTYIGYELNRLVGGLDILSAADLLIMYKELVMAFMTLLSTSVCWWFGSRPSTVRR